MATPAEKDDWETLIERVAIGDMTDEDWAAVVARVGVDDKACLDLICAVTYRQDLGRLTANVPAPPAVALLDVIDAVAPPPQPPNPRVGSPTPADRPQRREPGDWLPFRQRWAWLWPASVGALAGLAAFGAALMWQNSQAPPPGWNVPRTQQASTRQFLDVALSAGRLGVVRAVSPEAAAPGSTLAVRAGQQLRRGEVVQFDAGHISIELNGGAKALVEGPATLSLVASDAVFLRKGKLAVSGSDAFEIHSPLLAVEAAIGSVVAVDASKHNEATVSVLQGAANLFAKPDDGAKPDLLKRLQSGEGAFAAAQRGRDNIALTATPAATDVVASWRQVEDKYPAYQQEVLKERPLAYWSLDRVQRNCRVLDLTQSGYDGIAIGNWPDDHAPDGDRGALFNGASYIEIERRPPLDPRRGYSIECWAKVRGDSGPRAIFSSRWVLNTSHPPLRRFGMTLYAGQENQWQFWTGSGTEGEHWQRLVADVPIESGKWAHLVATFEPQGAETPSGIPGAVQLFCDGQLLAKGVHRAWAFDFEWPARIGAAEHVPKYLTSWLFLGSLSDLALYEGALPVDAVKRHFAAGSVLNSSSLTRRHQPPRATSSILAAAVSAALHPAATSAVVGEH